MSSALDTGGMKSVSSGKTKQKKTVLTLYNTSIVVVTTLTHTTNRQQPISFPASTAIEWEILA